MKLTEIYQSILPTLNETNKKVIDTIKSIEDFITVVNSMEKTPQRGFSYKPNTAKRVSSSTKLFHSTTESNVKSILSSGFKGATPYYSSFTKTRKSKEYVTEGFMGFGFDLTGKKADSVYQRGFLYGEYGIVFTADDAVKVYNTADSQNQVVFDVTKGVNILYVVKPKYDPNNRAEWVWDIYDKNFTMIAENQKLEKYIKQ